ncbi:hypothetical protein HYH02_007516 [Chlamydomonas schloesseri]|uniref:phytol kinase n=1 Tax=Chlamydomonas schloesseri TaxID=2026947 RepID=A0A836B508_9CHLO|nr:hypothetical protein HYH02_007516 [Chlamydomonas schloesseri]|eukprot:KAG2447593.1 hypothetical protein HYH02_007516 [Chlamydomonas schloesseri]
MAPAVASRAAGPSYTLRCALDAGLLPALEAALRDAGAWAKPGVADEAAGQHERSAVHLLGLVNCTLRGSGAWPAILAHAPAHQVVTLVRTLAALAMHLLSAKKRGVACVQSNSASGAASVPDANADACAHVVTCLVGLLEQLFDLGAVMRRRAQQQQAEQVQQQQQQQQQAEGGGAGGAPTVAAAASEDARAAGPDLLWFNRALEPDGGSAAVATLEQVCECGDLPPPGSTPAAQLQLLGSYCVQQLLPVVMHAMEFAPELSFWRQRELERAVSELFARVAGQAMLVAAPEPVVPQPCWWQASGSGGTVSSGEAPTAGALSDALSAACSDVSKQNVDVAAAWYLYMVVRPRCPTAPLLPAGVNTSGSSGSGSSSSSSGSGSSCSGGSGSSCSGGDGSGAAGQAAAVEGERPTVPCSEEREANCLNDLQARYALMFAAMPRVQYEQDVDDKLVAIQEIEYLKAVAEKHGRRECADFLAAMGVLERIELSHDAEAGAGGDAPVGSREQGLAAARDTAWQRWLAAWWRMRALLRQQELERCGLLRSTPVSGGGCGDRVAAGNSGSGSTSASASGAAAAGGGSDGGGQEEADGDAAEAAAAEAAWLLPNDVLEQRMAAVIAATPAEAEAGAGAAAGEAARKVVLCGNPACRNLEGPSAAVPPAGGKTCSRCRRVTYCSGVCQLEHWREGGHAHKCAGRAASTKMPSGLATG